MMLIYFRSVKKFFAIVKPSVRDFLDFHLSINEKRVSNGHFFFFVEHPDREMLVKKNRN